MGTKNGGIQLTAEEQTEHEAAQASAQASLEAASIVQEAKAAKKASGKTKLKALGLDY